MSLKNLNIDRSKIEDSLIESIKEIDINAEHFLRPKTENNPIYDLTFTDKNALIQFYFNNNGTTTIHYKLGKNQDISYQVAEYIKNKSEIDPQPNFSFQVNIENLDDGQYLIDYLQTDCEAKCIDVKKDATHDIYHFEGVYGDKLTITIYNNGTLQAQGKPLSLYKQVYYYLSEVLDNESIIEAQSKFYNIEIDNDSNLEEYNSRFPNSSEFLGDKLREIILPSLVIRKIGVTLTDYSLFVFPVLRGLEGYLKLLFSEKGVIITNFHGFRDCFKQGTDQEQVLTLDTKKLINSDPICAAIEKAYNYFIKERHTLFHVDSMTGTTRILDKREKAENIINNVINIINETFALIETDEVLT